MESMIDQAFEISIRYTTGQDTEEELRKALRKGCPSTTETFMTAAKDFAAQSKQNPALKTEFEKYTSLTNEIERRILNRKSFLGKALFAAFSTNLLKEWKDCRTNIRTMTFDSGLIKLQKKSQALQHHKT